MVCHCSVPGGFVQPDNRALQLASPSHRCVGGRSPRQSLAGNAQGQRPLPKWLVILRTPCHRHGWQLQTKLLGRFSQALFPRALYY